MTVAPPSASRPFVAFAPRPWVMGILNVTPDSFSDGGLFDTTETALLHGRQLMADGADMIDVGGESTRPGAHRVPVDQEISRVVPVITELAAEGIVCSVDTTRAEVAEAALAAGAAVVNDVSGGLADPRMVSVVAETQVPWVLMHWRGHSDVMADLGGYEDVVLDVRDELLRRVDHALAGGVDERSLVLDPGLGFAKSGDDNWTLLGRLEELVALGLPVLVGASRKKFLGSLLADDDGTPRAPVERDTATAATSALAARAGVWGVRVHAPRPTRDAVAVEAAAAAAPIADLQRRGLMVDGDRWAWWSEIPDVPVTGAGRYRFGGLHRHD